MIAKDESHRIRVEIRNIFVGIWDPIGVKDVAVARSEYDRYIGKIFDMLTTGATDHEIAAELLRIEREGMGLPFPGLSIPRTIAALRAIRLPTHSK